MKLPNFLAHSKAPSILTVLMIGGVSLTAIHTIPNPPLFPNTDNFVLFADQSLTFGENATVSSGDIGSNGKLEIEKDGNITGNLFADKISLDKNTSVNGNATFNKLKNEGEILGTKTTAVSLPIANLPTISPLTVGTQDQTIIGIATLPAGNYRDLLLKKNAKLTLSGGTYNLRKFELEENATLVFTAPTVLNIQSKLKGGNNVSIFNGAGAKHDDLHINVRSEQKNDRAMEQDDNETNSVTFGKNSFLNFVLLAPNASVTIGKDSTLRGQVLARMIKVGKNAIVSRSETFEKESDPTKIVTDTDGAKFIGNEIVVLFEDSANFSDAQFVAELINGNVAGFLANPPTYKIVLPTSDAASLQETVRRIISDNNPLVLETVPNFISESF